MSGAIVYQHSGDDYSQPHAPLRFTNAQLVQSYSKTGSTQRHFCSRCGSHLLLTNPALGLVALQPGQWRSSGLSFEPQVHVNYDGCLLRVADGLPKYKDFAKEIGGNGETCSE